MGLLYGRAGRLTILFGGFRPGQYNIFAYGDRFDPPYIAAFTATLRRFAPWLMFAPTTYFRLEGEELFAKMPSLALVLDAPHFPFRGEGMGKCNATAARPCPVPFPDRCSFCLAGDCGIATIPGAVDDIRSIYAHFAPLGRQIITGVIATRHSTCGTPSAKYVAATLPVLAAAEGVGALYVFRLVAPATNDTSCTSPAAVADKGCVARDFYGQLVVKTDVTLSAGRTVAQGGGRNLVENPDFVILDPKSGQPAHWGNIDGTGTPFSRIISATGPSPGTVSLLFNGTSSTVYNLVSQSMPSVQANIAYAMSVMIKTLSLSSSARGGYASITGSWKMRAPSTKPSGGTWPKGPGNTSDGFIKVLQSFTLPADAVPGSFVLALYVRPRMQGGPTPTGMA